MRLSLRSLRSSQTRRLSWGVFAQGLASLANLVVSFQGAAYLAVKEFGALATVLAVLYVAQAIVRAVGGEVYVAAYSVWYSTGWAREARRLQAGVLLAGSVSAIMVATAAFLLPIPGVIRATASAGAVALLPMLLFDCRRFILIARGETRAVAFSNLWLFTVQLLGGLLLWFQGWVAPWTLLLLFASSAFLALLSVRSLPSAGHLLRDGFWWIRDHIRLGRTFLLDALSVSAASQGVLILISVMAGLEVTASIRAAMLLLAPLTFLVQALSQQAVAEMSRLSQSRRWPASLVIQLLAMTTVVMWTALVMFVPELILERLLGENAASALTVLSGVALYVGASLAWLGPNALLRAVQATHILVRVRLTMLPFTLIGPLVVAQLAGSAQAVAYAMGAANAGTLLLLTLGAFFASHESAAPTLENQVD